jgi:hypothetical protein
VRASAWWCLLFVLIRHGLACVRACVCVCVRLLACVRWCESTRYFPSRSIAKRYCPLQVAPEANVVCKCEKVTEAEIVDSMRRSLPIDSTQGMRKRTRAGMGGCQGNRSAPATDTATDAATDTATVTAKANPGTTAVSAALPRSLRARAARRLASSGAAPGPPPPCSPAAGCPTPTRRCSRLFPKIRRPPRW